MKFNSIFSFLLPKKSVFFPLFNEQTALLIKGSDLFVTFCMETDKERQKEIYRDIKQVEVDCDDVTHKIIDELNNTFITPFDREDIRELADYIDDVADFMNSSAKRAIVYHPTELHPTSEKMSIIIQQSCLKVQQAIAGLENLQKESDKIMVLCSDIKKLEKRGDEAYEEFLNYYFEQEKSAVEIIKQTQIMKTLEKTINSLNEVGKVMKTIVIKYA